VASCVYPLSRDCEIFTESDKIKRIRKTILSMLKTRAPTGDRLASLCQVYGVGSIDGRFTPPKPKKSGSKAEAHLASSCILCGLCAQACASTGAGAISTVGRGVGKKVATPYDEPSADCIGCGSCATICPTKAIELSETKGQRFIWGKKFTLLRCALCDKAFATREEYMLAIKKSGVFPGEESSSLVSRNAICETCRKKKNADVFALAFGERV